MMKMLDYRKIATLVFAFGCNVLYATDVNPPYTPGSVTIPYESSHWFFASEALYVRTSLTGNDEFLGTISNDTNTFTAFHPAPQNWSWAYKLEGAYRFGTGKDIELSWFHMKSINTHGYVGNMMLSTGAKYKIGDPYIRFVPKVDTIRLELGQLMNLGNQFHIRFHGGFAYGHNNTSTQVTARRPLSDDIPIYQSYTFDYSAVAVVAGADLTFDVRKGFSIYAHSGTALFVGRSNWNSFIAATAIEKNNVRGIQSAVAVAPAIDGKLGATYTYPMLQGDLGINAYWMCARAIIGYNFSIQGAGLGLRWLGNF